MGIVATYTIIIIIITGPDSVVVSNLNFNIVLMSDDGLLIQISNINVSINNYDYRYI